MRFPWQKRVETRAAYTDQVVAGIVAAATGEGAIGIGTTATEESCRGLWMRAFAQATVEPEKSAAARALTPAVLALIGRQLFDAGEVLFEISVNGSDIVLSPASEYEITGRRPNYSYRLTFSEPETTIKRTLPAAAVLHLSIGESANRPWEGSGPIGGSSRTTAKLLAAIETRLAGEAAGNSGYLIPVPGDDSIAGLQADVKKLKGATALVPSVADGHGGLPAAMSPAKDWEPVRIGIDPPQSLVMLRDAVAASTMAAAGVPPPLLSLNSDGTSQNSSYRRFVSSTIDAIGRIIMTELQDKLDQPDLTFNFSRLASADHSMRGRALLAFTSAGVPLEQAMQLLGLMED